MTNVLTGKLTDPNRLVSGAVLEQLNIKVSGAVTRMFRKPENGGNPFLFALSAAKPHALHADVELAKKILVEEGRRVPATMPCPTAMTDGRRYGWHPEFLLKLTADEVITVMEHESYHIVFYHPGRMKHCQPDVRNWAMDYVVNTVIEHEREKLRSKIALWGGNLGRPLPMQELLDWIDGTLVDANGDLVISLNRRLNPNYKGQPGEEKWIPDPRVFVDKAYYGKSPESIYSAIMDHWDKSPRRCKTCGSLSKHPRTGEPINPVCDTRPLCPHDGHCCPECGAVARPGGGYSCDVMPQTVDAHVEAAVTKQDTETELMRASAQCRQMRGTVPGEVEDLLGELVRPTVQFTDLIRSSMMKRSQEAGMTHDWKRFKRRLIDQGHYQPKRHSRRACWLAMIDTSGSMSDDDISYGISQLQSVATRAEGLVVPCDAAVHWAGLTKVQNLTDLKKTKIVGRGGTVFDDFFRNFPEKVGLEFDAVIVITDGDCGVVPMELKPPIDVVWVLTRAHKDYKPSFGRVAPLRVERM